MFNISLALLRRRVISSVYSKVLLFKLWSLFVNLNSFLFWRSVLYTYIVCIMNQKCLNSPDLFCFVYGEFNSSSNLKRPTPLLYNIYNLYFGFKISESNNQPWTPSLFCLRCVRYLTRWFNGTHRSMPFYKLFICE